MASDRIDIRGRQGVRRVNSGRRRTQFGVCLRSPACARIAAAWHFGWALARPPRGRERCSGLLSDDEFDDLYRRHRGGVYRAIRGLVLDGNAVEDLAQDAFQRAWCERARWTDGAEAVTQVYRIAVSLAHGRVRRRRLLNLAC